MKSLLTLLGLFWLSLAYGQYSDTISCFNGPDELTYVIHYDQQAVVR